MAISSIAYGAIGVSIVFLFASVLVTHFQELFAQAWQKRPRLLKSAIIDLIQINVAQTGVAGSADPNRDQKIDVDALAKSVYNHGLVNGLLPGAQMPAYVPAKNFAMAFLHRFGEQVAAKNAPDATGAVPQLTLDQQIALLPDDCVLKGTLQALAKQADNQIDRFQTLLEKYYDNVMDRVGGIYKQWARKLSFLVGFGVVVVLNLDSIAVFRAIDADVRLQAAVSSASDVLHAAHNAAAAPPADKAGAGETPPAPALQESTAQVMATVLAAMKPLVDAHLPIGWSSLPQGASCPINYTPIIDISSQTDTTNGKPAVTIVYSPKCLSNCLLTDLLYKLLGWLVTAFAASFGAPYWFRVFEQIIRLTGMKPGHDEDEPGNRATQQAGQPAGA